MSFGKACAAVPAFAVVAGGQSDPPCGGSGRGACLARRGRFRGRWRPLRLRLVCTLAASLGALWRPFCGPCGVVAGVGLSVLLAWPLRALRGWRWCCLDWWRVVLAAVAVRAAPVAAVAVAGAPVKRARRRGPCAGRGWRCAGGVVRLSKSGRGWRCWRCRGVCGGRGGIRTRAACGGPPMVTALALAGRWV